MSRPFASLGFSLTPDLEAADAVLMGTCTIRQHAEDKAHSQIGRLREWKARDPNRLLIVAGCAAERLKFSLRRRHPHVDLVVGARSIAEFPQALAQALRERFDGLAENRPLGRRPATASPSSRVGRTQVMSPSLLPFAR